MKKIIAIIPARMGSTRFPGKPLAKIFDLPMIEHVRRRIKMCKILSEVYVATCDDEIKKAVESFGGKVIMTSKSHERCTDRIEEAARSLESDIIVNVQGDEPLITPIMIEKLVEPLVLNDDIQASCLVYPIIDLSNLEDINTVKAVMDLKHSIMYFSRSGIPNFKQGKEADTFEQSGVMAYKKDFLHTYSQLAPTPLECAESVDMLRIIEHGYKIYGVIWDDATIQVDMPEHISNVEEAILKDKSQKVFYEKILKL